MIKLLTVSASPVEGSSTEYILAEIADAVVASLGAGNQVETTTVRLNNLKYIPCQACGESPAPEYCLYDDDLTPVYRALVDCDCMLFGSPLYFDSVTAQAKAFIDRCNCFRPPDFDNVDPNHQFIRRLTRLRPAAMVLVGGEQGWFEGARRVLAGFFKWVQLVDEGTLIYRSTDFRRVGAAREDSEIRQQAMELGKLLAEKIVNGYEGSQGRKE